MRYQHKKEEELEQGWLLAPGAYWATVIEAEDQVSKKGNEMIQVKLSVIGPNGQDIHVYDYLSGSFMEFKLRHFCASAGKLDVYEKDELNAEDIIHWRVIAQLEVKKQEGYPDKMNVQDYFLESECSEPIGGDGVAKPTVVVVDDESSLPF